MKLETLTLKTPTGRDFTMRVYHHDQFTLFPDDRQWPVALIFPGGGFAGYSEREVEPVALAFLAKGYQAAVVRYNLTDAGPFYPTAATIGLTALRYLKVHAKELNADPQHIVTVGFSAGGHLAAMLAVSADERYWHAQQLVTSHTPPTFIWATRTDELVPVINSVTYINALCQHGVPFESHIYSHGVHGLAFGDLADSRYTHPEDLEPRVQNWFPMALSWLRTRYASKNPTEI